MNDEVERLALANNIKSYVTMLEHVGRNDCGCLSYAEAALFHNATQILRDLLESLKDE